MNRPRRLRTHELEAASRRAFDSALPDWLVSRPQPDDYGVDVEVEVFENHDATGLTFKVQLKATDTRGRTKERIKRSTINYWADLDVPVLIVLYNSVDQTLRYRWAHSIGADIPDSGAEKITLHFTENPPITAAWFDDLPDSLRLLRELRHGTVPRPLPVRLSIGDHTEVNFTAPRWGMELLRITGRTALRVATPSESAVAVELNHTTLRVRFPLDVSTATFDLSDLQDDPIELAWIAQTSLILISATVANIDPRRGGELAEMAPLENIAWLVGPVASRLAPALFESGNLTKLFELANRLSEVDDSRIRDTVEMYHLFMLHKISEIDDDQFRQFVNKSIEAIEAEAVRAPQSAGSRMYNLGHMHLERAEYQYALERFRRAVQLETRYASDAEFHRSMARAAFDAGEYRTSGEHYESFIEYANQGVQDVIPLAVDAFMYAGDFAKAEAVLATWIPGEGAKARVGWLRRPMLDVIRTELDIPNQAREELSPADVSTVKEEDTAVILETLRTTDALDPRLWAMLCRDEDSLKRFFGGLLIASEMMKDVPEVWCISLVSALVREEEELIVSSIIDAGIFFCGEEFIKLVEEFASGQSAENQEALLELLSDRYNAEAPRFGTRIRFLSDNPDADAWVVNEMMVVWE
jgi:tetratricopeptide (TPR) repeat protein